MKIYFAPDTSDHPNWGCRVMGDWFRSEFARAGYPPRWCTGSRWFYRQHPQLPRLRTMADFRGKIVVVFFGFTQCPDVCPTSMTTMAEVKRLLGDQGKLLQVIFITVDPERDTLPLLMAYMQNFDPTFLALRPEPDQLKALADEFKVYYKRVEGKTPTSYSMDHSAGKYIFDPEGRVRLFSSYGKEATVIAKDIQTLLASK